MDTGLLYLPRWLAALIVLTAPQPPINNDGLVAARKAHDSAPQWAQKVLRAIGWTRSLETLEALARSVRIAVAE